jgi:hypothetical protein
MDRWRKKVFFHCPSIIFRSVQHKFSLGGLRLKQIQFSSIYEWNSYQTLVCPLVSLYICFFVYLVLNTRLSIFVSVSLYISYQTQLFFGLSLSVTLSYFFVCFFVNIIPKTLLSIFMYVCLYNTYSTQCSAVFRSLCIFLS